MALKQPESMDTVIYFTRRTIEPKGHIIAWTDKKECPECKKALMGKPVEKGKIKIRALEYVCPGCGYTESKAEHEASLNISALYTCPECDKEGEATGIFKRKTYQGASSYIVECEHCGVKIPVTKRMKEPKKKK